MGKMTGYICFLLWAVMEPGRLGMTKNEKIPSDFHKIRVAKRYVCC